MSLPASIEYLQTLTGRLKAIKDSLKHVRERYESRAIPEWMFNRINGMLRAEALLLERRLARLFEKAGENLKELEETIRLLENYLTRIEMKYAAGEMGRDEYERKNRILNSGLDIIREEVNFLRGLIEKYTPEEVRLRVKAEAVLRELPMERAFYFYTDYDKYTGRYARSLEEFLDEIRNVEANSLIFHITRSDFQVWIRDLGALDLASKLDGLRKAGLDGEYIRSKMVAYVEEYIKDLRRVLKE